MVKKSLRQFTLMATATVTLLLGSVPLFSFIPARARRRGCISACCFANATCWLAGRNIRRCGLGLAWKRSVSWST